MNVFLIWLAKVTVGKSGALVQHKGPLRYHALFLGSIIYYKLLQLLKCNTIARVGWV